MEEIVFSVLNHGTAATEVLKSILSQFEELYNVRVRLDVISSWALGWSRLVENALYRSGPDISEAGNTWIGDLARMEALHPFTIAEVIDITKHAHLIENVWKSRISDGDENGQIYSIPWTGDTRAVYFRRDVLEKAGIDETLAFSDVDYFERTISTLQEKGSSMPLAITTRRSSLTIHYVATWVWSAGGAFLSGDGSNIEFDQAPAMEGCKAYFRLGRYLGPHANSLDEIQSNQAFRAGEAIVNMNGPWMLNPEELSPFLRKNMGIRPMPGPPFVGGQDLVVWNHSRRLGAAVKLIEYLHTEEAGKRLYPLYGLPVSEPAWGNPPFNSGFYPIFKNAIQEGRGLSGQLWGLVEKRLTDEYAEIWVEVLKSPHAQLETIIKTHLENLADRLKLSLGSPI